MGIVKTGLAVVGGIVILGVGIGACTSSNEEAKPTGVKQEAPAPKETPKPVEQPKKDKDSRLTQENYDKIVQGDAISGEGGSTEEEVLAIFGEPDSMTESEYNGYKSKLMSWVSLKNGSSIYVTVTNGKVNSKSKMKF